MVLAAITGVLLASTVEDLVPQADEPGAARWISTASFVAGFSFLLLLSAYFG
jgi:ZIP family zinc transporter